MKRYVFDGAPASGKSTILVGKSHVDTEDVMYEKCLKNRGFKVFDDSIAEVMEEIRREGKSPRSCANEILKRVVDKEIQKYNSAEEENLYIYNKGLHGYEIVPKRLGGNLPEKFNKFCKELKYSSPILLFEPILEHDISIPNGRDTARAFTNEDRLKMHQELKNIYEKWGYEVIEIPIFSKDKDKSLELRVQRVLEIIQ